MKIGIFPMVGDLLHTGHIKALEYAKSKCDYLITAMNCDPTIDNPNKNKPIESVYERFTRLDSCKYIDKVIPYVGEKDLLLLLQTTNYNIRFIGADHKGGYTGDDYEKEKGIEVVVIPRPHNESSTNLRQRCIKADQK